MASNLKISIDVLLTGTEQIKKLADALDQFRRGAAKAAAGSGEAARGAKQLADEQARAEANTLRHAQALARLQQATGNTAGAIRTLATALNSVNQQTTAAIRAQTQLAALRNNLNQPIVGPNAVNSVLRLGSALGG